MVRPRHFASAFFMPERNTRPAFQTVSRYCFRGTSNALGDLDVQLIEGKSF